MDKKKDWEIIAKIGGEGGSITLYGKKLSNGEWVFTKNVNEIFMDEGAENKKEETYEAIGWDEGKELINRYPLGFLVPIKIHPEWSRQIWQLVVDKTEDQTRLNRWFKACFPPMPYKIFDLYLKLYESKHTVVLTGAGMSTESGIPDFRSQKGWWKNINPITVASIDALENNYDLFHEFYSFRVNHLEDCHPHEGHYILGSLQKEGIIHHVTTQNVDQLHEAGGCTNVDHLHGSIITFRCHTCKKEASKESFLNKNSCISCGGKLRPNVVLFGEKLPENAWSNTMHHIEKADLVIVIGTSLQVYPVSQLPFMTNGKLVYINADVSEQKSNFDLVIEGSAGEVLRQVDQVLCIDLLIR